MLYAPAGNRTRITRLGILSSTIKPLVPFFKYRFQLINFYISPLIYVFMVERSDLEQKVRRLVSADIIYRILKSLGERGVRRLDKRALEIVQLLDGEENERFFSEVEEIDEEKARTLREGIDEFKKGYPKYGEILEKNISTKRTEKNKYLVYGVKRGFHLPEEDYLQVMMDLGFERREASSLYPHILAISKRLGKANEHTKRKILIS